MILRQWCRNVLLRSFCDPRPHTHEILLVVTCFVFWYFVFWLKIFCDPRTQTQEISLVTICAVQNYQKKKKTCFFLSNKNQHRELFSLSASFAFRGPSCFRNSFLTNKHQRRNKEEKTQKVFFEQFWRKEKNHLESVIKDAHSRCLGCLMVLLFPKDDAIRRALCTGLHALHIPLSHLLSISFLFLLLSLSLYHLLSLFLLTISHFQFFPFFSSISWAYFNPNFPCHS